MGATLTLSKHSQGHIRFPWSAISNLMPAPERITKAPDCISTSTVTIIGAFQPCVTLNSKASDLRLFIAQQTQAYPSQQPIR